MTDTDKPIKRVIKPVKVDANKRVIPKGSPIKPAYWRVNVGKRFTGTRKQRRFFSTEREAINFLEGLQDALKKKGTSAFVIEDSLAHEALALVEELKPYKVGLTEAIRFFIQHAPKQKGAKINDVIPEYLQTKTDANYRKAQEIALNRFAAEFGNKLVAGVFPDALRKWFKKQGWKPLNERNYMRDIGMFFKWCKLHDYCTVSPMEKVSRPKAHIATPPIYTVDETFKLLSAAREEKELAMLEFVAFAFFTGIRVEELERMDWQMVVWSQNEICLPESITKTHRPRNVPINDALKAWVQAAARTTGPLFESTNLRNRKDDLFDAAKVAKKRNAFRHTYASYHAAFYRNVSDLQMILGQRTPSVLFTHYVTATRKDEAGDFFALRPKEKPTGEEENSSQVVTP
jgi:integrase